MCYTSPRSTKVSGGKELTVDDMHTGFYILVAQPALPLSMFFISKFRGGGRKKEQVGPLKENPCCHLLGWAELQN
jgi:hypothetical protein